MKKLNSQSSEKPARKTGGKPAPAKKPKGLIEGRDPKHMGLGVIFWIVVILGIISLVGCGKVTPSELERAKSDHVRYAEAVAELKTLRAQNVELMIKTRQSLEKDDEMGFKANILQLRLNLEAQIQNLVQAKDCASNSELRQRIRAELTAVEEERDQAVEMENSHLKETQAKLWNTAKP